MEIENLSRDLLINVQKGKDVSAMLNELSSLSFVELKNQLFNDSIKKAFWINIYNAFNIILLKHNPGIINTQKGRILHFRSRKINIAEKNLNLNFIEHGLLRNGKLRK